ncbi:serine/threonine-protein kinase [uncultured Oscillibacter sp.]|uniref:serine/threonine protein kinase n=1 Tax=uncultured Oscillibacter sp. TaxID=876091 RepID=UPI002635A8E4|nr:serine/threonine-protein kinase [uncultured Oscillibacter sp.]
MVQYCPYCLHLVSGTGVCPQCGRRITSYQKASHHFPPGTLLNGHYVVGRVIGEGGFGITYLGLDMTLQRKVAIKEYFPTVYVKREASLTLDVTCYTDAQEAPYVQGREQFLQEARTLAKLDRVHAIVRILDFFSANNTAYIVMEYLEGDTLGTMSNQLGPIPLTNILEYLDPVLRAMDTMHAAGIIHRDISPDNIMRLRDGQVKLLDFGCARNTQGGNTLTVVLKHGYAPIEQYTGHNQRTYTPCAPPSTVD